jgi:WhiB family redox-sensing transcriptional regulator
VKSYRRLAFIDDGDWQHLALCARPEHRDLMWFPSEWRGSGAQRLKIERLRVEQVCDACPVIAECRAYAERHNVTAGVWAGKHYGSVRDED